MEGREEGGLSVAIIGAGFAGIGAAIQLRKAGIRSFTIFERASEVGGTWRDNRYPGAACDVPSQVYCFSFEPNPDWTRAFSEADEIQAYLRRLVDKWGLRAHLRFDTDIAEARFDEAAGAWQLRSRRDETFRARVVLAGLGGLVDPAWPEIKGIASFAGERMHSARWDHDYDLTGRRIAVIGTGASAVQIVPQIAPQVARLHVFQRTPAWVVPKHDYRYPARTRRFYARHPGLLRASRTAKYVASELFGPIVFLDAPRLAAVGERISRKHLLRCVRDPDLRAKLTPDFQFGCKRILISDDYWPAFERENVELVTEPIEEITRDGILTRDSVLREVDAIVFATGFELNLASSSVRLTGRQGRTLDEAWQNGAVAYKGMCVHGFPNWFRLMGPNTGPGHTSVLVFTEAQLSHALGAIRRMRDDPGIRYVDVRQDAQDRYNQRLQARMKHMVWSSGCNSWYLSEDGSNHSLFPGFASEYVLRARRFRPRDYEIARF